MSENTETRTETIENATIDDVRPGDHIAWTYTWEVGGVTFTMCREGIAHRRDEGSGDWRAEEGGWLTNGEGKGITITIRRAVRELPTKFGAVIVPADGHEAITATDPGRGTSWRAREAARTSSTHWTGVWRDEDGNIFSIMRANLIDADTWQEDNK